MPEHAREVVAKAFKECDLDCSQWDMYILRELADIAIAALQKDYRIYPRKK